MSFASSAFAMIASLDFNRRNRSSALQKMDKLIKGKYKKGKILKKATPEQLKTIRERIRKEQRSLFLKRAILFIVSLGLWCYFLLFHQF